jgi:hypothetical protein
MKSEVKSEHTEMKFDQYLSQFETEAAGYLVDELPHEFIPKFLAYLQSSCQNEIDPFKVPKARVDPNDPHLHEESKIDDKKRPPEVKPQAP